MKTRTSFFLLLLLFGFINCGNDIPSFEQELKDSWKLLRITGGLENVDCDYSDSEVLWIFNGEQLEYEINDADAPNNPSCTGFVNSQEVRPYTVEEKDGVHNLFLNNSDRGQLQMQDDTLTLDTQKLLDGTGADGFVYTLLRQ